MRLFVGDDWGEQHHDVELMDASGRRPAKARLPEGVAGMAKLHAMIAGQIGDDGNTAEVEVLVGIETDRGPWVQALLTAGYTVLAVNPLQAAWRRSRTWWKTILAGTRPLRSCYHSLGWGPGYVSEFWQRLSPSFDSTPRSSSVQNVGEKQHRPGLRRRGSWAKAWHAEGRRGALRRP
nr:IS110 family transposase [Sphaerisporangium fuscum]